MCVWGAARVVGVAASGSRVQGPGSRVGGVHLGARLLNPRLLVGEARLGAAKMVGAVGVEERLRLRRGLAERRAAHLVAKAARELVDLGLPY